jgi:tetratricopeptide (TPR) repeat protein
MFLMGLRNRRRRRRLNRTADTMPGLLTRIRARAMRFFKPLALFWKGFVQFFLSFVAVLIVLLVVLVLAHKLNEKVVAIEPISVTKSLSEAGYTPLVTAQRLRDAINDIKVRAKTSMKQQHVSAKEEMPDFVVPTVGISINSVATILLKLANRANRKISGEFTTKNGRLWFTARLDDDVIFDQECDTQKPDAAIALAAQAVLQRIQPYDVAAWIYEKKPPEWKSLTLHEVDSIIGRLPETDENVFWAYNMRGVVLESQTKTELATAAYRTAIRIRPYEAAPHYNLGNLLFEQRKSDSRHLRDAIAEYRTAIALDKAYFRGYNGLGNALTEQNDLVNAAASYETSIRLNPAYADSHYNLGLLRHRLGQNDAALLQLELAAKLDPRDPDAHNDAGHVWRDKAQLERAIGEYRTAIRLAPDNPTFQYNLGLAFRDEGRLDAAIVAFRRALARQAIDPDTNYYLAESFTAKGTVATSTRIARTRLAAACGYLNAVRQGQNRRFLSHMLINELNAQFARVGGRCAVSWLGR